MGRKHHRESFPNTARNSLLRAEHDLTEDLRAAAKKTWRQAKMGREQTPNTISNCHKL